MSEKLPELPPEVHLQMAQNTLWGMLLASWAAWADDVSWEKWVPSVKKLCQGLASQGTKDIIAAFKIPGNDCITVAKVHHLATDVMDYEPETYEMTPEKVVAVHKKCKILEIGDNMLPKFKDLPIEDMPCFIFDETMGKTVNPKITFKIGESFCKGGKICYSTWELKE